MVWLTPQNLCNADKLEKSVEQLRACLRILEDANVIATESCDAVVRQFKVFAAAAVTMPEFLEFDLASSRLDILYYDSLADKEEYQDLWCVVQKLLLLSHGQASVERGFSINKEAMVQNLSKEAIIAKRLSKTIWQVLVVPQMSS